MEKETSCSCLEALDEEWIPKEEAEEEAARKEELPKSGGVVEW